MWTFMTFSDIDVKPLFATPFITASFPPGTSAELNRHLADIVLKKEKQSQGTQLSNAGGWQSDDQLITWGGEPVQTVLASIKGLVSMFTLYAENNVLNHVDVDWKINGWANVNRKGHANVVHTHPGCYWSAIYYVQTGESGGRLGGELEALDPRGVLPLMYCPPLRCGVEGYTSAGGSELHVPRSGECVLFPSWLAHAVKPYHGDSERISLAFNFAT
jgi:uncharacterized protein (TIGR02466 family)